MPKIKQKHILIISHNSLSAGTSTQTANLIRQLRFKERNFHFHIIVPSIPLFTNMITSEGCVSIHYAKYQPGVVGYFLRVYTEFIAIPRLIKNTNPIGILALTNYYLVPGVESKKVVLVRHPYLLEQRLTKNLGLYDKFLEVFRNQFFLWTLKLVDHIIVQSNHMKTLFDKKYVNSTQTISVLPNPINTEKLLKQSNQKPFSEKKNIVIYPSRYYPHKNHEFLIELASKHYSFFMKNEVKFFITLDENEQTKHLFRTINENNLGGVINNTGEIPQERLAEIYSQSKVLFFPSKAETFGNSLVEALYYGLPIVAPSLPYAKAICGDAGIYYEVDNHDSAFALLTKILLDEDSWNKTSKISLKQYENFIDTEQWISEVLKLLTR
ncbi:MAG: glycosyltransferase [Bacteroidota bacterium]